MLSATQVSKRYGVVQALQDVDFDVRGGEMVALAGENGSGKSTLAKVLSGSVQANSGSVSIDGSVVTFASPRQALDVGVAVVAQELTTVPQLSVAENVSLPFLRTGFTRWISRAKSSRLAEATMDRLGLRVDPSLPAARLSTVQQALLEIAKALVTDPRFLILDEATSRLGPEDVAYVLKVVSDLARDGVGVVLITHRISEMTSACSRVVVLRDGRNAGELIRGEIAERPLVRLMVGRDVDGVISRDSVLGDPLLKVTDVLVDGGRQAVSMTVAQGEVVGLSGLVGAGRTELLEALAGVRARREGAVFLNGQEIVHSQPRRALEAGLAFVPEDRHRDGLVLPFSVTENYVLGRVRGSRWFRRARNHQETLHAVRRFGIKVADVNAPISALSGGNQQKVVLARALAGGPCLLVLDEPTRGVDIAARQEIYQIIASLADAGMGVLVASSDLVELMNVCDRILVMHDGQIVGDIEGKNASEEEITFLSAGGGQNERFV